MPPVDWVLCQYQGHLLEVAQPVPISVPFSKSCINASQPQCPVTIIMCQVTNICLVSDMTKIACVNAPRKMQKKFIPLVLKFV